MRLAAAKNVIQECSISFDRNIDWFSMRLTAVESSLKRERNLGKEDSVISEWTFEYHRNICCGISLKEVLAQVWAKLPAQGSEPFD